MPELNIDEIKETKHSLCDVENEHYQNSRSTDARSKNGAHLADICEIISKINDDAMLLFLIGSVNVTRLPRLNAKDVLERVGTCEEERRVGLKQSIGVKTT